LFQLQMLNVAQPRREGNLRLSDLRAKATQLSGFLNSRVPDASHFPFPAFPFLSSDGRQCRLLWH